MTDHSALHSERAAIVDAFAEMSDDDPDFFATLAQFRRLSAAMSRTLELHTTDDCVVD